LQKIESKRSTRVAWDALKAAHNGAKRDDLKAMMKPRPIETPDLKPKPKPYWETETKAEPEAKTKPEVKPGPKAGPGPEAGAKTEGQSGTGAETEGGAELAGPETKKRSPVEIAEEWADFALQRVKENIGLIDVQKIEHLSWAKRAELEDLLLILQETTEKTLKALNKPNLEVAQPKKQTAADPEAKRASG
jgi:hypothetical protein